MKNLFRRLFQWNESNSLATQTRPTSSAATRTRPRAARVPRLRLEQLEGRLLLNSRLRDGALVVLGDDLDNLITVELSAAGDEVEVTIDAADTQSFDLASVDRIQIHGAGGSDDISVDAEIMVPVEIHSGRGDDIVTAGGGSSRIFGGRGDDDILGGDAADMIRGRLGDDTVDGGDGDDTVRGGWGDDSIMGGDGDDRLRAAHGNDTVIGGLGDDTVNCAGNSRAGVEAGPTDEMIHCDSSTVTEVADSPVATDDAYSVNEDGALAGTSVLANDTDSGAPPLEADLVTGPTQASAFTLNADGTFTYTPAANFNGTDTFTYLAVDSLGESSEVATVTITVNSVNDSPVAVADSYTVDANTTLTGTTVLANDSDSQTGAASENNTPLTAQLVSGPSSAASFSLATDGTFTYTPNTDFRGADSFTYQALDSLGGVSATTTVTIRVGVAAVADSFDAIEDTTLSATSVLANDSDSGGLSLTAQLVSGPSQSSFFTLNTDGTFTYLPAANFSGSDTFTYQAVNSLGVTSNVATVTIAVAAVNDAPVVTSDSVSTTEDGVLAASVAGNIIDVESNLPVTISLVTGPQNSAAFSLASDGSFSYTPAADFNGTDVFTYQAVDSVGAVSSTASLTIFVISVNDSPVAAADGFSIDEDITVAGTSVLANDSDLYGGAASENNTPLTAQLVSGPASAASFSLASDGTFTYTPAAGFNGTDTFTYQAVDSLGGVSDAATVTIIVSSVNDAPVAVADSFTVDANATLNGTSVLANDGDSHDGAPLEDNVPLTAQLVVGPASAAAFTLNSDGTFTYTPLAAFTGSDSFTYQAVDSLGGVSEPVTVSINVGAMN